MSNSSATDSTGLDQDAWRRWLEDAPTVIDLGQGGFEEIPTLVFLRGLKASHIQLKRGAELVFRNWLARMTEYQQRYLEDPDVLGLLEWTWDEHDPTQSEIVIHVEFEKAEVHREKRIDSKRWHVPPMLGPMRVDPEAVRKFQSEVKNQSPRDVLVRFGSILKEFQGSSSHLESHSWRALVTEIATISLRLGFLERAVRLIEEHRPQMELDELRQLLSAYDPKPHEISEWIKLFQDLPTDWLLDRYEEMIPTSAGPSLLKLMQWRAQQRTEEFFEAAIKAKESRLAVLHQWLSGKWRPLHFDRLLAQTTGTTLLPDFRLWINALLRSDRARAYNALRQFFPRTHWFHLRYQGDPGRQRLIGEVLMEHLSPEAVQFVKDTLPMVHPSLRGFWQKILSDGNGGAR